MLMHRMWADSESESIRGLPRARLARFSHPQHSFAVSIALLKRIPAAHGGGTAADAATPLIHRVSGWPPTQLRRCSHAAAGPHRPATGAAILRRNSCPLRQAERCCARLAGWLELQPLQQAGCGLLQPTPESALRDAFVVAAPPDTAAGARSAGAGCERGSPVCRRRGHRGQRARLRSPTPPAEGPQTAWIDGGAGREDRPRQRAQPLRVVPRQRSLNVVGPLQGPRSHAARRRRLQGPHEYGHVL